MNSLLPRMQQAETSLYAQTYAQGTADFTRDVSVTRMAVAFCPECR